MGGEEEGLTHNQMIPIYQALGIPRFTTWRFGSC